MKQITTILLLLISLSGVGQVSPPTSHTIKVTGSGTSGGTTKYSTTEYGMLTDSATTGLYKFRADSTVLESQARAVNRAATKQDTLSNYSVTAGTYTNITVNGKGLATAVNNGVIQSYSSGPGIYLNDATNWLKTNPLYGIGGLTIVMPASPVDGQELKLNFGGSVYSSDSVVVQNLTLVGNIVGTKTFSGITPDDVISFKYAATESKWYRQNSLSARATSTPPLVTDALVWLNGSVVYTGGNYYFKDQTGNGRNFLITGYDFDSTLVSGFPYKSAATISAPAGDATLIAADLNSFLYTSGTPNQIPVVSLFQDIDYEHKMFARHKAQLVDINGVETYEPRIQDIVVYNTVKAGVYLTDCNAYFSVPTEIVSNVKWVSKTGSNSNAGTKAAPYLTLQYASNNSTTQTVYIKSGSYSENDLGSSSGKWGIAAGHTQSYIGLGFVQVSAQSASTNVLVISNRNDLVISGLYFNDAVAKVVVNYGTIGYHVFDKNYVKNALTAILALYADSILIKNSVLVSANKGVEYGQYVGKLNFNACLINSTTTAINQNGTAALNINFFNSKTTAYLFTNSASATYILGSKFTGSLTWLVNTTYPTATLKIRYSQFSALSPSNLIGAIEVVGNILIGTGTKNIYLSNSNNVRIDSNIIISSTGIAQIGYDPLSGVSVAEIKGNYIDGRDTAAPPIIIGNELGNNYNNVTGTIENNRVKGAIDYNPLASGPHGITVFNNSGVKILRNYISGVNIGLLVKTGGLDCTNSGFFGNVVTNCNAGIYAKGAENIKIYNNTLYNNKGAISVGNNTAYLVHAWIKNNLIVYDKILTTGVSAIAKDIYVTSLISDSNLVYFPNNPNCFSNDGGSVINISAWRALGYDIHSVLSNPLLSTNLVPSLPISIGANLGTTYQAGLSTLTNFGGQYMWPVIVTKNQVASGLWQVGAYVQ